MTRPVALITGASAGIGSALAHVFARNGYELVLVARREARLEALADEIAVNGHPRPRVMRADLTQPDAVDTLRTQMTADGIEPDVVVNNAGYGLVGSAASLDHADELAMIDLNVRALTALSLAFIEPLVRRRGGILNVASVAAFLPGPGMAVYHASKAYVLSFGQALHRELKGRGVRVTTLCPGPVRTEFQARAGVTADSSPALFTLSAARVAQEGYRGLMCGRRVVIPGFFNKLVAVIAPRIPARVVLGAVWRRNARRSR